MDRCKRNFTHSRPITAAAISDDGSAVIVADDRFVTWLRRDLSPRWRKDLQTKPAATSIDSFGRCVAVAEAGNRLQLFDKGGKSIGGPFVAPRPLFHLAFLPAEPILIGAADFGLVIALDLRLRQWCWQDAPVIHLGDLSPAIAPAVLAVACFSEGVRRYDAMGRPAAPYSDRRSVSLRGRFRRRSSLLGWHDLWRTVRLLRRRRSAFRATLRPILRRGQIGARGGHGLGGACGRSSYRLGSERRTEMNSINLHHEQPREPARCARAE